MVDSIAKIINVKRIFIMIFLISFYLEKYICYINFIV
ncbi:hypothetical protein D0396_03185 [Staphylococcus epidermidis]|nr:hypothetical protein CFE88_09370 [Staphylococcus epidermidis]ATQ50731.1 hypothetical protein CPZ17_09840 [Staphylococcus epidermidis]ATQ60422.1 hypothetical protein CPZ21_09980 [Staphylococcus epidermidis]MBM0770797.1 hypothetical protein [Staphylococcus epidermidis]MBM0812742.1 hypothetical protein [Staphylococcus epidermidis]